MEPGNRECCILGRIRNSICNQIQKKEKLSFKKKKLKGGVSGCWLRESLNVSNERRKKKHSVEYHKSVGVYETEREKKNIWRIGKNIAQLDAVSLDGAGNN